MIGYAMGVPTSGMYRERVHPLMVSMGFGTADSRWSESTDYSSSNERTPGGQRELLVADLEGLEAVHARDDIAVDELDPAQIW